MEAVSAPYRSYALISRQQIAHNYRNVRSAVGTGVEVAAVVKADAYGHGMLEVARVLVAEGARHLAVASVDEGVLLREAGIHQTRILVMGGFLPYEGPALVEYDLTAAVHSIEQIQEIDRVARSLGARLGYHLKIDSGMGRLGTRAGAGEILAALAAAPHAKLEGLMTHLASPADFASSQTDEQLGCFRGIMDALRRAGVHAMHVHASSTGAIGYGRREGWFGMVRAGLSIYGYVPQATGCAPKEQLLVKPALTWKAKLVAVQDVPEGAPVGYGGTFRAPQPMRIGVAGAGYADGVRHALSNRGHAIADGKLTRILGAVSMDLTTIDLSHTTALVPGDDVTLLGVEGDARLDAQQIAAEAGTIAYDVLCGIGARVRRVYL
jgi:alanine racemase